MLGLGKYFQSWFYKQYLTYTNILVLWIKGCQLFRNCVCDATHKKSFGLGLTGINEVRKRTDDILDDIFVFFKYWSCDRV